MGNSKKFRLNECAVSDVLGEVLMTIIVVIMMTSIGMCVFSESKPPDAPHIDIYEQLDPFNDTIVIRNNGGESIPLRDLKLVLHSGSTEYVITGEELSGQLIEECGDNGYWDLSEYISVNVLEVCGLDLENRDEDLDALLIHTPSKKVIYSSSISSIYLDDTIQSPNDRIPRDGIPGNGYEVGYIWIPPQLLALDNSVSPQNGNNKPDLIGSACLDDVQNIGGGFTTYYPDDAVSMHEYFEFGLNESVLKSFGVTFSGPYEDLDISGAKIKIRYAGHDGSFRWVKLQVWDQTDNTLYEYDIPEYKKEYGEKVLDLPHITNVEDLENLNVYIVAQANPGKSGQHYIHIDYIAAYIPCSGEESPAQNTTPVAEENLIHIGSVNVTTSKQGSDVTASAVVTILDNNNTPVEGATVSGDWSGAASDTDSAVTGVTGTVTVYSNEVKQTGNNALTFTFTVNGVTHSSYTWDGTPVDRTAVYS